MAYVGVIWEPDRQEWQGSVTLDDIKYSTSGHATDREAAIALDRILLKLYFEYDVEVLPGTILQVGLSPEEQEKVQQSCLTDLAERVTMLDEANEVQALASPLSELGVRVSTQPVVAKIEECVLGDKARDADNASRPSSESTQSPEQDCKVVPARPKRNSGRLPSSFIGVTYYIARNKWKMRIRDNGRLTSQFYDTEEEAARAYDRSALLRNSKHVKLKLNFPREDYAEVLQRLQSKPAPFSGIDQFKKEEHVLDSGVFCQSSSFRTSKSKELEDRPGPFAPQLAAASDPDLRSLSHESGSCQSMDGALDANARPLVLDDQQACNQIQGGCLDEVARRALIHADALLEGCATKMKELVAATLQSLEASKEEGIPLVLKDFEVNANELVSRLQTVIRHAKQNCKEASPA